MKYALIGCGRISPNHIAAAIENNLKLVAICDTSPEKMEDKFSKFSLNSDVKKYTDYKEMLKTETPDLVAIATESGTHAAIALDCIRHGCNLIIEKPLAMSIRDANMIIELSQKKDVVVSACHQNRFNKSIFKIREALDKGRFGKLFHGVANIRWNLGKYYYKQAPWRGTWAQDGGTLMNQCIHNIDLLIWMMGNEVSEVVGFTDRLGHPYIEAEDFGIALLKFTNGAYGLIEGTTNIYPENFEETLYIFGEKGTVKAGGKSVNIIEHWRFDDNLDDSEQVIKECGENPPNVYGFGHIPLYRDVIDSIKNGRQPYVDAYAGKRALELVLAIYKSAKEKSIVKLPLKDCETLDFS